MHAANFLLHSDYCLSSVRVFSLCGGVVRINGVCVELE